MTVGELGELPQPEMARMLTAATNKHRRLAVLKRCRLENGNKPKSRAKLTIPALPLAKIDLDESVRPLDLQENMTPYTCLLNLISQTPSDLTYYG